MLPRVAKVVEYVEREAELGVSLKEYIIDLLVGGLDPKGRVIGAAKEFLEHAREELEKGNI